MALDASADREHASIGCLLGQLLQLVANRNTYPGEKLLHPKRLRDVIIGTKIEGSYLTSPIISAGQYHDRNTLDPSSN